MMYGVIKIVVIMMDEDDGSDEVVVKFMINDSR